MKLLAQANQQMQQQQKKLKASQTLCAKHQQQHILAVDGQKAAASELETTKQLLANASAKSAALQVKEKPV